MMRSRTQRGFTLIELMIVIAILAFTAAVAAMSLRSTRGEKAPAFARTLLTVLHEARSTALATGLATRVRVVPATGGTPARVMMETADPTTRLFPATGIGGVPTPADVDIADVLQGADVTGAGTGSTKLLTAKTVCFQPSGSADLMLPSATQCPTTKFGATIYVRSFDGNLRYKLLVFGATGMPRILDTGQTW